MKLAGLDQQAQDRAVFPCFSAGASLKQRAGDQGSAEPGGFPLLFGGGLIEADLKGKADGSYERVFPCFSAGASLKPHLIPFLSSTLAGFPLLFGGGLIEAGV